MAASLDEIQGYELFQYELEALIESFLKEVRTDTPLVRYILNALVEFACFNCFFDHSAQLNEKFSEMFVDWMEFYSPYLEPAEVIKVSNSFVTFINKACLK